MYSKLATVHSIIKSAASTDQVSNQRH